MGAQVEIIEDHHLHGMDVSDTDEMADGAGSPGPAVPHDDFDLQIILGQLSNEVPTLEAIMEAARRFDNSHRFLINEFILQPSMDRKKMNFLFTKHFTTVKMNLHPEAFLRVQISPEESRELSRTIVKAMNTEDGIEKKDFRPWRFAITTDERSPKEYVTMTGCSRNSTILSGASSLTKAERALFLAILEEMMCEDGTCRMTWIHRAIRTEPHKLTGTKCDEFLKSMIRQSYFLVNGDVLEIAPRSVVEMEPWLRAKFGEDLRICELCRRIISRPVFTAECVGCKQLSHYNCFRNATILSKQINVECSKCGQMLTLDEVDNQVERNKANGVERVPLRTSRSAAHGASGSNEVDEMSDGMDVDEMADEMDVDEMAD